MQQQQTNGNGENERGRKTEISERDSFIHNMIGNKKLTFNYYYLIGHRDIAIKIKLNQFFGRNNIS